MAEGMRERLPIVGTAVIFLFVQIAALVLAPLFPSEYQAFEDADNPINPLVYLVMILLVTGIVLIMIKYGKARFIQAIFLTSVFVTIYIMFIPLVYLVIPEVTVAMTLPLLIAATMVGILILRPEWYVINVVGMTVAAGITAILGMSLGILPAMIFLILLMVYDAIAVYKTKHMLTLADGVMPLGLPVLFVLPKKRNFKMSSLKGKRLTEEGEEREAVFMGLGDSVIPGILVVSSFMFLPGSSIYFQNANLLVAIGTMIGSFIGYLLLMRIVYSGKPQAGLPFLNGGAIVGFLVTYIIVFQEFGFGMF